MIPTQNSFMQLLIGKNIARTASVTVKDQQAITYAKTGEIVVTDVDGTVLDSTTVLTKKQIVIVQSQGVGLPVIKSPIIDRDGVKTYNSKLYVAPQLQVDYIGLNAVTGVGDIDVINSNDYEVQIKFINTSVFGSNGIERFGFYTSDSTATKAEILNGLTKNIYQNFSRLIQVPLSVERVAAANSTNTSAATGTLTVTNGSTIVTASVSATAEFVIGDYIRFGIAADDTAAVYKIVGLSGVTMTLDLAYQGASAVIAIASAGALSEVNLIADKVGIRLTAKPEIFITAQITEPYINSWKSIIKNAGSTPIVTQVGATRGSGTYSVVASLEEFLIGNEGAIARNNYPNTPLRKNAIVGATYNFLDLEFVTKKHGHIFDQESASKQLLIAFDFTPAAAPTQVTGAVTSVQTVLNAWLSSNFAAATLA